MFDVGDKTSFDIGLGGPKDHVVSFFFISGDFFSKLHHLTFIFKEPFIMVNIDEKIMEFSKH